MPVNAQTDDNVRYVFRGWLKLTGLQQAELSDLIDEYRSSPEIVRERLRDTPPHVSKMEIGPLGKPCPCCGT